MENPVDVDLIATQQEIITGAVISSSEMNNHIAQDRHYCPEYNTEALFAACP
jgi:hypothetical protein